MELYLKIVKIIKPLWKQILTVFLLTILYVFFNNLSLWISVDFVQELFSSQDSSAIQTETIADSTAKAADEEKTGGINSIISNAQSERVYKKIEKAIKGVLIQDTPQKTLLVLCIVLLLSFYLKNITQYFRRIILYLIELKITISLRNRLQKSMVHLPLRYFDKKHTGELNSIVFNDVYSINQVLNTSFGKMILSPIQIIANLVILFTISWKLSLFTLTIIPISSIIIVKIGQSMRRRSRRMFEQTAVVIAAFHEAISGIRIVKAFTNEDKEVDKFEKVNDEYFNKTFRQRKLNSITSPLNEIVYVTMIVGLLWYGGNIVFSHAGISAGDFLRFLIFLFMMIQPIKDLSGVNNTIQTGMAAAERVFSIIDSEPEKYEGDGSISISDFKSEIRLEHVYFYYNREEGEVLKDLNLTIKKGEMVAFVGPSGAGKSTLINIIPRFYEVSSGNIYIDGINTKNVTLKSLRRLISIVTQDTILFNDTIRKNIAYGLDNVSEEDIIHAARVANAWEFIKKMDEGLDTQIGERGIRLSGGQKQRISIARAILKNPPILILDEATSSLDTESERLVQEAIDNLLKDRTVLVIAHRLSTIKNANKIVVMNRGEIEAVGTHDELLLSSKVYKNLYENQIIITNSNS